MPQRRSSEMQLVGYALARCGVPGRRPREVLPPPWLGATSWRHAYEQFYPALAAGRDLPALRNTLKNARDAFDAHVENARVGWVDHARGGKPWRADAMVRQILEAWDGRPEEDLAAAVLAIRDGALLAPEEPDGHDDEPSSPPEGERRTEGGRKVYVSWRAERKAGARGDAVRIHGNTCMGCRFDFAAAYGPAGAGYIEVHHVVPLADHGTRETDPATDLIVLCANCHRIVHRKRGVCPSLEGLRRLIDNGRVGIGLPPLWSPPLPSVGSGIVPLGLA